MTTSQNNEGHVKKLAVADRVATSDFLAAAGGSGVRARWKTLPFSP